MMLLKECLHLQCLVLLWQLLASVVTVTSQQDQCVQWYKPVNPRFGTYYYYKNTTWEDIDSSLENSIGIEKNIISRSYKLITGTTNCLGIDALYPLRLKKIGSEVYWINIGGNELLTPSELEDMEPGELPANAEYGAFNQTTHSWTLVDSSYIFGPCMYIEIIKRKDLRTPFHNNPATNGIDYMWRYDVVLEVNEGTSMTVARQELANALRVSLESVVWQRTTTNSYFRVTLPALHPELPPLSEIPPTQNIKIISIENVGECFEEPMEELFGEVWPRSRPAQVVIKRDPWNPTQVISRECMLSGLPRNPNTCAAFWNGGATRWTEELGPC